MVKWINEQYDIIIAWVSERNEIVTAWTEWYIERFGVFWNEINWWIVRFWVEWSVVVAMNLVAISMLLYIFIRTRALNKEAERKKWE